MEAVDWRYRGDYMWERHGIEALWANEALADPEGLQIIPDPASRSGRGLRTIGYSPSARDLITVITVVDAGTTYGVNGWRASDTDRRRYREGRS